ncbi:MAG: glutamine-hydrolyzing carbamoyl-phosphate synthase small subunit [Oligoflexus sp.]
MRQKCSLILSDGTRFQGDLIGAPLRASGELVFTTGMVGYSEAITDPSYFGQILCFTYPLIGNYGIPDLPPNDDGFIPRGFESSKPHAAGVILTIDSPESFHWNSFHSLDHWLKKYGVPGIVGLDTRHLVHTIRNNSNLLGRIDPEDCEGYRDLGPDLTPISPTAFFDPGMNNIVDRVSSKERRILGKGNIRVGLVDCGAKWNIIRQFIEFGCEVELLPWSTDFSTVDCDMWVLSNGPGDPTRTGDLRFRVQQLLSEDRPIIGICLGHQILSLAAGATTKRMSYGHRSHNQPVYEVGTRRGYITSQNHGYVVEDHSLPEDWVPWFRNVNDQSIEGIRHTSKPFRSVQFHPEASGGPRDTAWIFEQILAEVKK